MKKIFLIAGLGLALVSCKSKKNIDFGKTCEIKKAPLDFLQPAPVEANKNTIPLTAFSFLENDRKANGGTGDGNYSSNCEIYKIVKFEDYYKLFPDFADRFRGFVESKNKNAIEERKKFIEKVKQLENDTGLELTEFEERLIGELYLIDKYKFNVVRKGSYTFTAEGTPEKINFFLKELGIKKGLEYVTFYYLKNKKAEEIDVSQVIYYNPPVNIPNKQYVTVFKQYGRYIFQDLIDKQNAENAKLAEEEKKKAEEELKKQLEQSSVPASQTPAPLPETSTVLPNFQDLNLTNNTSSTSTSGTTATPQQEIPLPEAPKFVPHEVKKPRSGGNLNFEKKDRPEFEKENQNN